MMDSVKKRGASTKNTLAKNNAKLGMVVQCITESTISTVKVGFCASES